MVVTVLYALAILSGGTITWRRAFVSLKARMLDMNVLMTIAVVGAAAIGEWQEGATVIFLFALGGWLESRSLARTRRSIPRPSRIRTRTHTGAPGRALRFTVPTGDVRVGETLVVRPGERVALDGVISVGSSAVDEAPITGESLPGRQDGRRPRLRGFAQHERPARGAGHRARRGLHARARRPARRGGAGRTARRPSSSSIASRAGTPRLSGLAVRRGRPPLAAPLLGQSWGGFESWVYRALVLLVVSCPCALVISTPVAIVSAITRASRDGVLVKGGAFLEIAPHRFGAIAFDKTGTLTLGQPGVVEIFADGARARLLRTRRVARGQLEPSGRPCGRAEAERVGAGAVRCDVRGAPGRGVGGLVDGRHIRLVSPSFAAEIR